MSTSDVYGPIETTKDDTSSSIRHRQQSPAGRLSKYLSLDDFEKAARQKLPNMIWGYVDGAVETGSGKTHVQESWQRFSLIPNVLKDVAKRRQDTKLFGKTWTSPFGIAPVGGAAMVGYRADLAMAKAARRAGIPMVLSASSLTALEDILAENPDLWFQAYLAGDITRISAMIDRVQSAGVDTLMVTADTPVPGNRENNIRSGFSMPLRITPRVAIDSALHPRWLLGTIARTFIAHGIPHFENMDAERGPAMFSQNAVRNMDDRDRLTWDHMVRIRDQWKGKFVIKGILSAADAKKAREIGADGIIASNHGGRQLDHTLPPIFALPAIKANAGDMAVMIDGGIRRGTDLMKALALGADFAFLGRPFLYAAAVAQENGVYRAAELLAAEIHRNQALLGVNTLAELTPQMVSTRSDNLLEGARGLLDGASHDA